MFPVDKKTRAQQKVSFIFVLIPWYPISYLTITSSGFFGGGAYTGPYPTLRFGRAFGLGVGTKTRPRHFHHQKVLCDDANIYICIALKIINTLSTDHRHLINCGSLLYRSGRHLLNTTIKVCAIWAQ